MWKRMTPFAKIFTFILIFGGIYLTLNFTGVLDQVIPQPEEQNSTANTPEGTKTIKIGVVTWGGYAGGQYWNKGFDANTNSNFYKDYGFLVEFKVLDDFVASREAWKSGEVDLLWATVDAFPTEAKSLEAFKPKVVFQADWSRGGDAIVARRGISKVSDLKGKKVAVAYMTPSHSFLINLLETSNLTTKDVDIVEVASAIDAASMFKSQSVDAAVVWSPDDADCVDKVAGSKILQSTKTASNIIADVFFAKEDFIDKNEKQLKQLFEGWMKGAAEINSSEAAKKEAAQILEKGLGMDYQFCYDAINNVRLTTLGDNQNFFGLGRDYLGVTGEELYSKMGKKYNQLGFAPEVPNWRTISTKNIVSGVSLAGPEHSAEGGVVFEKPTEDLETTEAISTKQVTITFPTGSYTLDENAKYIIDLQFLDIAKSFGNARIRIQGNTDNTGSLSTNVALSKKRAQAVADYLANEHGFDANRFVVVGNGPNKPVADNSTSSGRAKNRRTDFELISE